METYIKATVDTNRLNGLLELGVVNSKDTI